MARVSGSASTTSVQLKPGSTRPVGSQPSPFVAGVHRRARRRAAVSRERVAVVTELPSLPLPVPADHGGRARCPGFFAHGAALELANAGAAISGESVAVVAGLGAFLLAVAARRLALASTRARLGSTRATEGHARAAAARATELAGVSAPAGRARRSAGPRRSRITEVGLGAARDQRAEEDRREDATTRAQGEPRCSKVSGTE